MPEPESKLVVDEILAEFKALKAEQTARIGFRDNLIYVTVAAIGAVFAFALGRDGTPYALLVVPWVAVVLGWTYLVNDEKISAIGRFIKNELAPEMLQVIHLGGQERDQAKIFGWEVAHRSDKHRVQRKVLQLLVDLMTFVGSSFVSIAVFLVRVGESDGRILTLLIVESVVLLLLTWQILVYADLDADLKRDSEAQAR
jgi:L-asparagine transporter-like permease